MSTGVRLEDRRLGNEEWSLHSQPWESADPFPQVGNVCDASVHLPLLYLTSAALRLLNSCKLPRNSKCNNRGDDGEAEELISRAS